MSNGRSQKSKDTALELAFRRELRALSLGRYYLHHRIELPPWRKKAQHTTPDVAFPAKKIAIYLDGCYWHGCLRCYRDTITNQAQWRRKRALNRARDERHSRALMTVGWRVFRTWEHEDPRAAALAVRAIIETDADPGIYGLPQKEN